MTSLQSIKNEVLSNKKSIQSTKKNQAIIEQTSTYTFETTYYSALTTSSLSATTSATCPKPDMNDDCYVSTDDIYQYAVLYSSGKTSYECLYEAASVIWSDGNPDKSGNGCLDDPELINYILLWMDNMFGDVCVIQTIMIWQGNCTTCKEAPPILNPSTNYVNYDSNDIDISPENRALRFINEYDYRTPYNKIIYHEFKWRPLDLYMLKGRANTYPIPQYYSKEFVLNIKSDKDVYDYCKLRFYSGNKTYGYRTNLPEPNDVGVEESSVYNACYVPIVGANEEIEIASPVDKIFPLGTDTLNEGDGVYSVYVNIKSNSNQNTTIRSIGEIGNHVAYFGAPCIGETITDSGKYP